METKKHSTVDVNYEELTESIASVIPDLSEMNNYQKKVNARRYLVEMGKAILPQLNNLLLSKNIRLRREASKIIEIIGDKESIPVLINLLEDDEGSIRWIAAEGLIHIGRESIVPLLKKIIENGDDTYLKMGARHAFLQLFNDNEKVHFQPLLQSLKNFNNIHILAPVEAFRALIIFKHQSADSHLSEQYWH
jgi:HEAT repeat protein